MIKIISITIILLSFNLYSQCQEDLNDDGLVNVIDIVSLVNFILFDGGCEDEVLYTCQDIIGQWDGVTQYNDILNEESCPLTDSSQDISWMNWGFESDGVIEKNSAFTSTVEEYYNCISENEVKICSDENLTENCMIYSVSVVPNQTLQLTYTLNNGTCVIEEALNFVPEN